MLNISLKLENKSRSYLDSLSRRVKKGVSGGVLLAMLFAADRSKNIFINGTSKNVPPPLPPPGPLVSRSGTLRSSIRAGVIGPGAGYIGSDVIYGRYHELGEGRMPARPFLSPSFEGSNMEKIKSMIIKNIVKEMTKRKE